eukprot:3954834-Karenia_brevis.AAC.1
MSKFKRIDDRLEKAKAILKTLTSQMHLHAEALVQISGGEHTEGYDDSEDDDQLRESLEKFKARFK